MASPKSLPRCAQCLAPITRQSYGQPFCNECKKIVHTIGQKTIDTTAVAVNESGFQSRTEGDEWLESNEFEKTENSILRPINPHKKQNSSMQRRNQQTTNDEAILGFCPRCQVGIYMPYPKCDGCGYEFKRSKFIEFGINYYEISNSDIEHEKTTTAIIQIVVHCIIVGTASWFFSNSIVLVFSLCAFLVGASLIRYATKSNEDVAYSMIKEKSKNKSESIHVSNQTMPNHQRVVVRRGYIEEISNE